MVNLPPLPKDPIADEVRSVAERLRLRECYAALDAEPAFPWPEFRALGAARLLGLRTPAISGGRELSLRSTAVGLFHLAYWGGTTFAKLSLQPDFSSILAEHGSSELVDRFFRPMVRGEFLVGNQITEPGAGSDVGAIALRADRDGDTYVLNGVKSEVAFAIDAQAAIVYGRVKNGGPSHGEITAFLVTQDLPGIHRSVRPDLGERWMRRGTVTYQDVRVSANFRIGEEGLAFEYLKHELTRERALLAAIYLGVARASWDETVRYVGERTAFGKPLAAHQAVSFPLVEDWVRCDAAWLYTLNVLERLQSGDEPVAEAALAKWMATEAAMGSLDHAIQFHGGRGYSKELPHEQRWRDVRSGAIAHGPSEIMHVVASRTLWPRGTTNAD